MIGIRIEKKLQSFFLLPALMLLGMLFLFSCSSDTIDDSESLASIGEFSVSEKHFLVSFRRYYERAGRSLPVTDDLKKSILENEMNIFTSVKYAQDNGWDSDAEGERRYEQIRRQVLMEEYERRLLFEDIVLTEEDLMEMYYRTNTHLRASHLFARDRHSIDSLYTLLQNGQSFEELAKSTFESRELRENAGDLGFFTVDEMDIGFEDAAYRLEEGEISKPVRTSRGYSIIKVTEIITQPILTEYNFSVQKPKLRSLANQQKGQLARRNDMYESIARFDIDEEILREVWDHVKNDFRTAITEHFEEVSFLSVPSSLGNKRFIDNEHHSLSVNQMLYEAYYTPDQSRANISSYNQFLKFAEGIAFRTYAVNKIKNSPKMDRNFVEGSVESTFHSYLNRRLVQHLMENIEIDESAIRHEFERNQMHYQHPVELNLAEIIMDDWDEAEIAWNKLKAGKDFYDVLEEYSFDEEAKIHGGELGYLPINNFGGLSPTLSNKSVGDYAGPFEVQNDIIFIFKVLGRKEARPMTYEEAYDHIKNGMREQKVEEQRNRILAETREKHNAQINYAKLSEVTLSL